MNSFKIHTIETAPAESKDILQKISDKWGFIPNFMAIVAESPAMLESYDEVFETNAWSK